MKTFGCMTIVCLGGIILAGCAGGGLTPNQKIEANKQWNNARASVLAGLAEDQYKSGNLDKCQETLDQALRLEPDKAALHMLAAKLSIEQGNLDAAEAHLAAARRLDPKDAQTDYLTGIILQRWRRPQQAHDAYAAAVQKDPAELSYLLADAETLVSMGKSQDAIDLLQSKAAFFEHSGVLRDELGQLLIGQKRFVEGIAALREAAILSADDLTIREHLAFALYTNGQFVESAGIFARLVNEPAYQGRADVQATMGDCQARNHQLAEAQKQYDLATKLNPSCSGYWLGLATVTSQVNDLPRAELAARKAASLDPANSEAQCLLGYVTLQQGKLPQSLAAFRASAALDPSDSVSVSLEGYVLDRMGRKEDAQRLYAQSLQLNPHDALANRLSASASPRH